MSVSFSLSSQSFQERCSALRNFVPRKPGVSLSVAVLVILLAPSVAWAQDVDWNEIVGVFSEDGEWRLDIGKGELKADASHDSWASRLVIKRLDGESSGPVSKGHVVGIFSEDDKWRLDIGGTKQESSHESWATRLRIVRLDGLSLGPVTYGDVVGVFSEDGKWRLDIGKGELKADASHDSWATRLKIGGPGN